MSKGLEALKRISWQFDNCEKAQEEYLIIEQELKALEIIKENVKVYGECFAPLGKTDIEHIYLDMKKYVSEKNDDFDLVKEVLL